MNKHIPCKRCSGSRFIYVTFSEGNTGTATPYICPDCNGSGFQLVQATNADCIRAMSDEELANLLTYYSNNGGWVTEIGRKVCYEGIVDWLRQPAEEEQL